MPDSWVTTQKKLSFACDTTADPAPRAMTTRAFFISVSNPSEFIIGAMMDAAVIIATVEEP